MFLLLLVSFHTSIFLATVEKCLSRKMLSFNKKKKRRLPQHFHKTTLKTRRASLYLRPIVRPKRL